MEVAAIINLVNAYKIRLTSQLISIKTNRGEVLSNLALLLPKFTQVLAIKSSHRSLLI